MQNFYEFTIIALLVIECWLIWFSDERMKNIAEDVENIKRILNRKL
jgi:hypothetical protein